MDITLLLLGAVVTAFTQVAKRYFPNVPPLTIVVAVSFLAGMFQAFILPLIPEGVWLQVTQGFTAAVTFYELLLRNMAKRN